MYLNLSGLSKQNKKSNFLSKIKFKKSLKLSSENECIINTFNFEKDFFIKKFFYGIYKERKNNILEIDVVDFISCKLDYNKKIENKEINSSIVNIDNTLLEIKDKHFSLTGFIDSEYENLNYFDLDFSDKLKINKNDFINKTKFFNTKIGSRNLMENLYKIENLSEFFQIFGPLILGINLFAYSFPFELFFYFDLKNINFKNIKSLNEEYGKEISYNSFNDLKRFISLISCGCYPNFIRQSEEIKANYKVYGAIKYTEAFLKIINLNNDEILNLNFNYSDFSRIGRYCFYFDEYFSDSEFFEVADQLNFNELIMAYNYGSNEVVEFVDSIYYKRFESSGII